MSDLNRRLKELKTLYREMEETLVAGSERLEEELSSDSPNRFAAAMEMNGKAEALAEEITRLRNEVGERGGLTGEEEEGLEKCRRSLSSLLASLEETRKKSWSHLGSLKGKMKQLESGKRSLKEYLPGTKKKPLFLDRTG